MKKKKPEVLVLMGSQSDWPPAMQHTCATLEKFEVPYEARIISAHRTPDRIEEHVVRAHEKGVKIIVAGAGCAAHLAGVCASKTHLPVIGVPIKSDALNGMDSLLSTVQMPAGKPVATMAIGKPGAINAALLAVQILALSSPDLTMKYAAYMTKQSADVPEYPVDDLVSGTK